MPVKVARAEKHPDLLTLPPRGIVHEVRGSGVQLQYEASGGQLFCGDSVAWLATLTPATIDLCFADPPYNIKKAEWDTFESHQSYVQWSRQWVELAARALKPTGSLYICGFSEILADLKVAAMPFFRSCRWLVWHSRASGYKSQRLSWLEFASDKVLQSVFINSSGRGTFSNG